MGEVRRVRGRDSRMEKKQPEGWTTNGERAVGMGYLVLGSVLSNLQSAITNRQSVMLIGW